MRLMLIVVILLSVIMFILAISGCEKATSPCSNGLYQNDSHIDIFRCPCCDYSIFMEIDDQDDMIICPNCGQLIDKKDRSQYVQVASNGILNR